VSSDQPTETPPGFASRPVTAADEAVLLALFGAVRAGELHLNGWEPSLRDRMLRTQFEAQRRGYREEFPAAVERLILHAGIPIGWVIVDASGRDLHGIDIGLLPEHQSKGVGTHVIRALQQEAAAEGRRMIITVQRFNVRARALYERLGFRSTSETDTHVVMEWRQA
jgi:GNAT superfamily N-acetyltransferase